MMTWRNFTFLLFAASGLVSMQASAADHWFLLAREGGCYAISALKFKLPDMPEVQDPQAFMHYLESNHMSFSHRPLDVSEGRTVEVNVPDAGLGLIFVTEEACQ